MTITERTGLTSRRQAQGHADIPAQARGQTPRPGRKTKVSVVIPTLNEARNLEHVFAALPADLHEVI
jgi:hypothetical protein